MNLIICVDKQLEFKNILMIYKKVVFWRDLVMFLFIYVFLFLLAGCGHCKKAKPEFMQAAEKLQEYTKVKLC